MNRSTQLLTLALVAAMFGLLTGCGAGANQNAAAGANTNANANVNTNANSAAADTTAKTATASAPTESPTDAYKAAHKARENKDVPALKAMFSKDILEFFEEMAKGEKKTIDDEIKEMLDSPQAKTAEARNEKITGDTATIEYLDEKGGWRTMDFVNEGGKWKLTVPKADPSEVEVGTPPANKK